MARFDGRSLRARRYLVPGAGEPRPLIIDFHGGGFVIGSPELKDWFNGELAARLGAIVVSPRYRLAPEHRYPAAHEDAVGFLRWAGREAPRWGADPGRLALLGDSAGAILAGYAAHASVRDPSLPMPAVQVLLYPGTDFSRAYQSQLDNTDATMLTAEEMSVYLDLYFGDHDRRDPNISLLRMDKLDALPPAIIVTAEYDLLRDQGVAYADALRRAGVPVRHSTYLGTAHGFVSSPGIYRAARQVLSDVTEELRARLAR